MAKNVEGVQAETTGVETTGVETTVEIDAAVPITPPTPFEQLRAQVNLMGRRLESVENAKAKIDGYEGEIYDLKTNIARSVGDGDMAAVKKDADKVASLTGKIEKEKKAVDSLTKEAKEAGGKVIDIIQNHFSLV
jgi:hypothetical protein